MTCTVDPPRKQRDPFAGKKASELWQMATDASASPEKRAAAMEAYKVKAIEEGRAKQSLTSRKRVTPKPAPPPPVLPKAAVPVKEKPKASPEPAPVAEQQAQESAPAPIKPAIIQLAPRPLVVPADGTVVQVVTGPSYVCLAKQQGKFVLVQSLRGAGKTRAILSLIVSRALAYPGSRWLICRSTRQRLADTVMKTLDEQVLPLFNQPAPTMAPSQRTNYRLPCSSELIFHGLDDPQRDQSAEYAGIYVSEGVELESKNQVVSLGGALRQEVPTPPGRPPLRRQCIIDYNPGAPSHWLNEAGEDVPEGIWRVKTREDYQRLIAHNMAKPPAGKWKRIISTWQDNPRFWDFKNWCLTPDGQEYLDTLSEMGGFLRKRWLEGEWAASDGAVFGESFDRARNVIPPSETFPIPEDWPIYVGIDPSHTMTAILWLAVGWDDTQYIIDEYCVGGKGAQDYAAEILRRNAEKGYRVARYYMDPQYGFSRTAMNVRTIAQQYQDHGLPTIEPWPATGNQEEAMVESVRTLFRPKVKDGEEWVGLKIFGTCVNTIRSVESWGYKLDKEGRPTNVFDGKFNDESDVIKGLVALRITYNGGVGWKAY